MTFASNLTIIARRLLSKFGELCYFTRDIEGDFDPNTGGVPTPSVYAYAVNGAPMNFTRDEIDHTTILQTDLKVWVEANSSGDVPAVGDVVTFAHNLNTQFRVLSVRPYFTQGQQAVYALQVRI